MESIEAPLANLGFTEAIHVKGRASIADLFRRGARCGIYVLHFTSGEYYAGKAVDVTRRCVQHCKVHTDIERISFRPLLEGRLKEEERQVICTLEAGGFRLLSITQHAEKALSLLDEPEIIAAIRRLNLGLMRKGPSLNSLSHCMDLADRLLEQ